MFYKWIKYLAAETILHDLSFRTTVITGMENEPMFAQSYGWENLQKIQGRHRLYSIATMRDAAWMLKEKNEIDILNNEKHIFNINLKAMPAGITALKEKTYVWKVVRPSLIALGSLVTLIIGIIQLKKML